MRHFQGVQAVAEIHTYSFCAWFWEEGKEGDRQGSRGYVDFVIDAVLNVEPVEVLVHGDDVVCLYHQSQTQQYVVTSLEIH